jgi:hypothetical protein
MPTVPTVHFLVHRRPFFRTPASSRLLSLLVIACTGSALPPPSLAQEHPPGLVEVKVKEGGRHGFRWQLPRAAGQFYSAYWFRPAGNRWRPSLPMTP